MRALDTAPPLIRWDAQLESISDLMDAHDAAGQDEEKHAEDDSRRRVTALATSLPIALPSAPCVARSREVTSQDSSHESAPVSSLTDSADSGGASPAVTAPPPRRSAMKQSGPDSPPSFGRAPTITQSAFTAEDAAARFPGSPLAILLAQQQAAASAFGPPPDQLRN